MRLAVVDIGTNSTRLLIAEHTSGKISTVGTGLITSRLGEGIGTQSCLQKPAMKRTIEALLNFREIIKEAGVAVVIVAATSAVRDAANREEFLQLVKNRLGWEVQVLPGSEEAEMSYLGAVAGLKEDVCDPVVIDIGGGSTELIWPKENGLNCVSLRIGAVRMTEKDSSLSAIREMLAQLLSTIKNHRFETLVGVGGTLTTLAAIDQELKDFDPARVHGYFLKRERVVNILNRLQEVTLEERKRIPGLQPERADIIIAGVRIATAVMEGLDADGITVSETGIMHGLLDRALNLGNKFS